MWDDAKALNALAATLVSMAVLALAASTLWWLAARPAFAFREVVVVTPLKRASAPHLEAIIREEIAGTFFTMRLDRARSSIAGVPWVREVALRRQWPPRLEVSIEEHVPLAHFGEGMLVNTHGETFVAAHSGALPRFAGPQGASGEMAARYREWTAALQPLALEISELSVSARGGWRLRAEGVDGPLSLELGRDDTTARLTRFAAAYGRTLGMLARRGTRIDHVDLRYRNGFAARIPGFREAAAGKSSS